ncbi:MAG: site-specific DNA-methyltransferase [Acidithiobacillus sp.]
MPSHYDHLDRESLIKLLQRRDADRSLGLVWEREGIEMDRALNDDYVAMSLVADLSHGGGPWENLIIEGDNFDALRALRVSHKEKVHCIYIDPPYNTLKNDFVYNDRFVDKAHRFRHSLWLEFMYQRLTIARDLLSEDGVILVSIDDHEMFRLGMLMDRVFGEENKAGVIVWKNVTDNNPSRVATEHEYVLVYMKDKTSCPPVWKSPDLAVKTLMLEKERELLAAHKDKESLQAAYNAWFRAVKDQLPPLDNYKFIDRGGIYAGSRSVHNPGREGYRYDVLHDVTGRPCRQPLMGYRFPENTMRDLLRDGRILFGVDESKLIELKIYLRDYQQKLPSVVVFDGRAGANELRAVFPGAGKVFNNPKPVEFLSNLLSFVTSGEDLVLDFFAGSGSTAQAVHDLNCADGQNRRYILISSTEATNEEPDKNLCLDVCAERVRRVTEEGFAYLRTRRIAKHRITMRLDHAEVWNALQLLHGRPVSPWSGHGLSTDAGMAYLRDFSDPSLDLLAEWGTMFTKMAVTLYSWSPERVKALVADTVRCQPIPQHLRDRFGR